MNGLPNAPSLTRLPIQPPIPRVSVGGIACVQSWQPTVSRAGNAYVTARIGHRDGYVTLRLFESHLPAWEGVGAGDAICVTLIGKPGSGGYGPSWECSAVERLDPSHPIRLDLLPPCPVPFEELTARWDALVQQLSPAALGLLLVVLRDVGEEAYRAAPAAKGQHHAVAPYGLWWHSMEVAELALAMRQSQPMYHAIISTDVLILGGLLHDVGKIREYRAEPGMGILMSPVASGRYHTTIGIQLVTAAVTRYSTQLAEAGTPEALIEGLLAIIESHHALKEYGSPSAPASVEGWFIHAADVASANAAKMHALLATATPCDAPSWYRTVNGRPDFVQAFHEIAPSTTGTNEVPHLVTTPAQQPPTVVFDDTDWITVIIDQESR